MVTSPVKSLFLVHEHESNAQSSITDHQEDVVLKTVVARLPPSKGEVEEIEEGMSCARAEKYFDLD